MPTFIAQGCWTKDAVQGMTSNPEDRFGPVAELFESLGGRLLHWFMTTGEHDWLIIAEAPSHDVMMAAAAASLAGGGTSDIKTCAAFTAPEAKAIFENAGRVATAFKSPGLR
ncbi:GYD domain-containing protein [Rubellimicrobium mesophilum]|nr:GYD domain-containing protein [Rubellimicrobium mesophilum]